MNVLRWAAASALLASLMLVGTALASDVSLIERGTINDISALNGSSQAIPVPQEDIKVGDAYTLTATFDLSRAELTSLYDADPTINIYYLPGTVVNFHAGTYTDTFSPGFEFNSSLQLWNNYNGSELGLTLQPTDAQSFSFFNYNATKSAYALGTGQLSELFNLDDFDFTATARSNDLISELAPFSAFGSRSFDFGTLNSTTGDFVYTSGNVVSETLVASATPEPASWVFMIFGVALLGVILRHCSAMHLITTNRSSFLSRRFMFSVILLNEFLANL